MIRKFWSMLQSMPAEELQRFVREAEDRGLEGIWVPQLAFTRSPVETALSALDVAPRCRMRWSRRSWPPARATKRGREWKSSAGTRTHSRSCLRVRATR